MNTDLPLGFPNAFRSIPPLSTSPLHDFGSHNLIAEILRVIAHAQFLHLTHAMSRPSIMRSCIYKWFHPGLSAHPTKCLPSPRIRHHTAMTHHVMTPRIRHHTATTQAAMVVSKYAAICIIIALMSSIAFVAAFTTAVPNYSSQGYTQAALDDEIVNLPRAPHYSRMFGGYIDLANNTHHAHYLFITAKNPSNRIMLWLNGGPGCDSLLGAFTELGPYQPDYDPATKTYSLKTRGVTWNENINIIYLESPDVGYTYVDKAGYPSEWTDELTAQRSVEFLEGFVQRYPNYFGNGHSFSIAGESYGGHYVPQLAQKVISFQAAGRLKNFNFDAMLVGNPLIQLNNNEYAQILTYGSRLPLKERQEFEIKCKPSGESYPLPAGCAPIVTKLLSYVLHMDPYAMSFPMCVDPETKELRSHYGPATHFNRQLAKAGYLLSGITSVNYIRQRLTEFQSLLYQRSLSKIQRSQFLNLFTNFANNSDFEVLAYLHANKDSLLQSSLVSSDDYFPANYQPCDSDWLGPYLSTPDVVKAMNAKLVRPQWSMCEDIPYSASDQIPSMVPVYKDIHKRSPRTRVLIYSGQDDTICSTLEAQMSLFDGQLTQQGVYWQDVLGDDGQFIGHQTQFAELTITTVNGAGHMVPQTRETQAKVIAERWTTRGQL